MSILLLFLAGGRAEALVVFDFEQPLFTEPPEPVLDHCVVEQDGLYHLFYLRGNPAVNVGHATTLDFVHWTMETPVLAPGAWDSKALWAPYLYRSGNGWFMYYTGVNLQNSQQTGLAGSTDLVGWAKFPNPVYHPDPAWAEWSGSAFCHGRDPHVLEYNGRYYLFNTAKTNTNRGAVACAVSDDLMNWQDIGPMYVHYTWHVLESVFILPRNGKFHMFFTEEAVNGTSQMTSDSLLSGWDITTRRIVDSGHAPQITPTNFGDMFSRHSVYNDQHGTLQHVMRFTPITWLGDVAAIPKPLPLQGPWTFVSGDAFYYQPTWGNNAAVRNDNYESSFVGDGWINTYEYYTGPLGYGAPGVPNGDGRVGVIRSQPFVITGNSMNLLVGGGDVPDTCYVALVNAQTGTVLHSETGKNSNVMDRRYWDVRPYQGTSVYLEIADKSTAAFGHICVDDIRESHDIVGGSGSGGGGGGIKKWKQKTSIDASSTMQALASGVTRLFPNAPNPFNPVTRVDFELAGASRVRLEVFDASGARVRTLVDDERPAGRYSQTWNGTDASGRTMPSAVYFCRLTVDGNVIDTRKMILLK